MKIFTCLICYFLLARSVLALDTIAINEKDALFSASDQTVPIVTASYIGWNAGWKWAGASITTKNTVKNNAYVGAVFTGSADDLGIKLSGNADLESNRIVWRYRWDKTQNHPDALGFGIQFNLNLNSPSFISPAKDPELLPGDRGWQWTTPSGNAITVSFDPLPKSIYFERNQKNTIRALFFNAIESGSQTSEMTVTVSPSVKITGPVSLSHGGIDKNKWHSNILSSESSPVDLSLLNDGPAGKHGFVKAQADKLVFEDGTPAKFWGANIMAGALYNTSDFNIKRHAKRIAQLGFNLIRIHHHDSSWVNPNIFKNPSNDTLVLSDAALKKLDWWIKCLKDEGVYVWLDLHVGRKMTRKDGVTALDDFAKGQSSAEVKGFNYYNESVQKRMQDFNQAYLTHLNPFTQLANKDDPAVIALMLTNENDLTHHFGNALLADKGVPLHNRLFFEDAKKFAEVNHLDVNQVAQTWLWGPSKIYLNDAEHRFNRKMIDPIKTLGSQALISTTSSWGGMSMAGLPSLTDGDIIDAHSYGRADEFKYNPRFNPGFLSWLAAAQISGKPLSVTEWNIEPFPAVDRFTSPVFTAGIADLQGWDAMMLYGYSQAPLNGSNDGSNYSAFNDPAIMGLMPAAALLYRQNHVAQARNTYTLTLDRDQFYFKAHAPNTSKTIRTLLETSQLTVAMPDTKELPWLQDNVGKGGSDSSTQVAINDVNRDFIPAGQNFVESDTGELRRDWNQGIQTINTEKSQIASGWIGGEQIKLDSVLFDMITPMAVVAVQSLQDKPISESQQIFITAMARSETAPGNKLPFYFEPVVGKIYITAPKGLQLFPVKATGSEGAPIPIDYTNGQYEINLTADRGVHWLVLKSGY